MDAFSDAPKTFNSALPGKRHVNVTFRKGAQLQRPAARYIKMGY